MQLHLTLQLYIVIVNKLERKLHLKICENVFKWSSLTGIIIIYNYLAGEMIESLLYKIS